MNLSKINVYLCISVVFIATSLLTGCGKTNSAGSEIIVFAAASLTETMNEIKTNYEAIHPEVSIVYNFDSSGTLKTQITEGAECDLFFSAASKQMNQLDEAGMILADTRRNMLENKVCLVTAANGGTESGEALQITDFGQLFDKLREGEVLLAVGNADVPVGQYTEKIFTYYGMDKEALAGQGCITYGTNVKEVTTQISEGLVDCGIIYATDAYSAGLKVIDTATAEMCGQVIYPAAVLKDAKHIEAAKEFLAYLDSESADKVFEGVGFSPIP